MLTAESIVGKLVVFVVEKTLGKLVALPLDKRRKACRSLTKLYYCVQCLDDVTESFMETIDGFRESGDAYAVVNALNNHAHDIEFATNMFTDLGYELQAGLEIIDPALAACCHALYVGKFDFLSFLSNSVHWEKSATEAKMMLKRPLGKMEAVDMENMYDLTDKALQAGEKYYWPSTAFDDFRDDFEEIAIGFQDEEAATQLRQMIAQQNAVLKTAKERLRNLIKESFSIEEVLFQTDSHPYR